MKVTYLLYKDKLKGEYAEVFDKIQLYTEVHNVDFDIANEMLSELLDSFLDAQKEDKPVKNIIGSNIEQFCRLYFKNYSSKQRMLKLLKQIKTVSLFVLIMEVIHILIELPKDFQAFLMLKTDVSVWMISFFGTFLLLSLINLIFKSIIFSWKRFSIKIYNIILFGSFFLVFLVATVIEYDRIEVSACGILLISGGYLLAYSIVQMINRICKGEPAFVLTRERNRRNEETGEKISYINMLKEQIPFALIKRYEKINRKRQKKGKGLITHETYMQMLEKDCKRERCLNWLLYLILVIIILCTVIAVALDSSLIDTLIFTVILCVCEIPVLLFMRAILVGVRAKAQILEACKRANSDLFTLYKIYEEKEVEE